MLSVLSVVVQQQQQQQQQKGTTENTEDTEARHQEPSSKQRAGVALPRVAVRQPKHACAAGISPRNCRESTDSPAVVGFAPAANPRTGSARVP
ncbi:MAG: hypothetical protein ACK56S_00870 [Planctomycetota bacterium]